MNNSVNFHLKPHINFSGDTTTVSVPNNYSNNTKLPANRTALIDHSNPSYNQLAVNKKLSKDDQVMYSKLSEKLDKEGKILLDQLSKNGKLLSTDANDGSSTLQNLYKIMTEPRLSYFESKNIIKEALKTLTAPYTVTQNFGKIPEKAVSQLIDYENVRLLANFDENDNYETRTDTFPISRPDINFLHGNTCPGASIEFNLADKRPAEFVRYVEGLTSPEKSVKTKLKYADLSPNMTEALGFLVEEKADFKALDWNNIEVTVKPDEKAYLRANVQEDARIKDSRSIIDVLMQSAFMQLGSRNTYNSLTDNRSHDTGDGKGLNQMEIAFVETIVDPESKKIPLVYMQFDDEITKITNYNYGFESTKKHFIDSINSGKNIIVGFMTDMDQNGNIKTPSGHEIMLTGYKYDQNGQLWFKYNDTDDGNHFKPSWITANELIPTVHHANIPQDVLKEEIPQQEIGYLYLQDYRTLKQQKNNTQV